MSEKPESELSGELRRMAEKRMAGLATEDSPSRADADLARTVHELQVHQVELELQNEELREARHELEVNASRFTELYDFAPVGYFCLDEAAEIQLLNFMGARLLGKERAHLYRARFLDFVAAESRKTFIHFLNEVFAGEPQEPCEVKLSRPGQPAAIVKLSGILSPNGLLCRLAAMDITAQRAAEKAAREKNEDLNRIFQLSEDLLGLAGYDGRFTRVNPAFQRVLGHQIEEMLGHDLLDFIHPDDQTATRNALDCLKAGMLMIELVNRCRCKDGTYRWLEWRVTSYDGESMCALGRDITARKMAEDALKISEEQFRSIVESSPMAMYVYRLEEANRLVMIGANPAADREIGIEHHSLLGKTLEQAFPNLTGSGIPEMFRAVAKGELKTQSFDMRYDGENIGAYFEVHVFRTSPQTIVVAFMNINDRVEAEDRLKKNQDELEARVQRRTMQLQERTVQLRALAGELTMAEERERRRIAGLIHDYLQQMLVAALMNLRMLKSKATKKNELAELERIETIITESIETTRSLTAELSPPVLHQCGLAAALNWLRQWFFEKYGLNVEVHAEEGIDPGEEVGVTLFQSVRELLFNIVKHSGVKTATLSMNRAKPDMVKIEVRDTGAGFDPEAVRAREGTTGGFGLFNVRERMELLGGHLESRSAPGCGSRFTLLAPLHPVRPDEVPANGDDDGYVRIEQATFPSIDLEFPTHRKRQPGKTRIVIADDHSTVREGLVRLLQTEPDFIVVGEASDGREAFNLARKLRPDFVIMDVNMPRMNGLEATAAIHKSLPEVKVLGLSTHVDDEHRIAMIRAGAVDLLHKNSSPTLVVATLRNHVPEAAERKSALQQPFDEASQP